MGRREFQFTEGTSKKFWAIELDGACHTVHFGRIGTAGQAQTKEFGSEAEARKSYDKLVAEKVKKGYVEVSAAGAKAPAAPTAKPAKKGAAKKQEDEPAAPAAVAAEQPAAAVNTAVTHVIDLDPADWQWATWRKRTPLPKPEPPPFDFEDCLARLAKLQISQYGWCNWDKARIAPLLSRPEAEFWLTAMASITSEVKPPTVNIKVKPPQVAEKLAKKTFTGQVSLDDIQPRLKGIEGIGTAEPFARAVVHLLTPDDLVVALRNDLFSKLDWKMDTLLLREFRHHVFPSLSNDTLDKLRPQLRRALASAKWPQSLSDRPTMVFHLAALVGLHEELLAVVRTIPDDFYGQSPGWDDTYYHQPHLVIFGLGEPALVEEHMRRLKLLLTTTDHVRAWLAHTELSALDHVRDSILSKTKKDECEDLLEVFALVKAPVAAAPMLELKLGSKAPQVARRWLDEQAGNAVAGLIPAAAGRGRLAETAVEYLREAKRKGHEALLRQSLAGAPADAADKVRREVLEHVEKVYEPLDARTTPSWLASAAKDLKAKPPGWASAAALPPVTLGERRLNDEQVAAAVAALQRSTFAEPHALVKGLKEHADPAGLDAFAWRLFELWLAEGAPTKEKWAMTALGLLGGDSCALKLAPLVRAWPGESQHKRAVVGLECLRAIGSDTALMQLNGIAQKLKFKGLKSAAMEFMEAIAQDRKMTRAQLEDRIVPDCGLDERGSRVFDFGPRKFTFVLGPEMKPLVKDDDGKLKPDLPKPGAKDDAALAGPALEDWKLLKKQVREVAKIQAERLEQAMVTGRRWEPKEFETLIVRHPLMTNLARLLVWGGYDAKGKLALTFRVTEEQEYADARDEACNLKGVSQVGLVHPLHLSDEQRSRWGELLSDYEIIPPFPQLGRPIHTLTKEETKADEIARFKDVKIPAASLIFGLEKLGWQRGIPQDAGCFYEHSKAFYGAEVTAVVEYEGGVGVGYIVDAPEQQISHCFFLPGIYTPEMYPQHKKRTALNKIDPVVISEVLGDLSLLAAKGK